MMLAMRRLGGLLFAGLLLCVLGAGRRPPKILDPLVKLTIGFRPTVVVDLALLRAIDGGEFRRLGIDVALKPYGRADLLFAALKSEEIQGSLGVPLEPILNMAGQGEVPYRGFLLWYFDATTPYDGFVVLKNSPIMRLADLEGKVVGSHPSRQVKHFVSLMLPKATVQEYNPATPLLSVKAGEQSAAYVLEPALTQAATNGDYRIIETGSISRRVFGGDRIPAAMSLLSAKWIEANPDEARAFVELARKVHAKDSLRPNTSARVALLGRKEFGSFSREVAERVVEPASSTPERLDRGKLRQFFNVLREGRLLPGDLDFERLLYVPSGVR